MPSQFHDMLKHNFRHQDQLLKITEPLNRHLGIDTFWQYSIEQDGRFINLGNVPDSAVYHYDGGVYKTNSLFTDPRNFSEGCVLLEGEDNWESVFQRMRHKHPMHHAMLVMRKTNSGRLNCYGFASTQHQPLLRSVYLNQQPLIQSFVDYWVESTGEICAKVDEDAVDMRELRGEELFYTKVGHAPFPSNTLNEEFLEDLGMDPQLLRGLKLLTPREREVLVGCAQGKTAQETAKELFISRRTVEHHLDSAKDKFNVWSKSELRVVGQKLIKLRALSSPQQ